MTTVERGNLAMFNSYYRLREGKAASNVAWNNIKSLNTHLNHTVWQLIELAAISLNVEYDYKFEPSFNLVEKVYHHLNN